MSERHSIRFGTSGVRGLVGELMGMESYAFTAAFMRHIKASEPDGPKRVLIGEDLRSSSPGIMRNAAAAISAEGFEPVDCGFLPTPALALAALLERSPAVMVTGSHIPDDRNGLKFYGRFGEITKADETAIVEAYQVVRSEPEPAEMAATPSQYDVTGRYIKRYLDFFPPDTLAGLRVGVYQHSSVARDIIVDMMRHLGAEATVLGRSDTFIPVDTEAHRQEDVDRIAAWCCTGAFDALVSTDGDGDRPLIADETGRILRGDVIGLLTAKHLGLSTIVTPVTSSSAIEGSGVADQVVRTKVGSPYVLAGMEQAAADGLTGIVGFEANGGVLLLSDVERAGRTLVGLATRDAMLPIISVLAICRLAKRPLSSVVAGISAGYVAAHRLPNISSFQSGAFLKCLASDDAYLDDLFESIGVVGAVNTIDGVRVALKSGEIVHFRASGNAPELRCYVEASSPQAAKRLLDWGLSCASLEIWRVTE